MLLLDNLIQDYVFLCVLTYHISLCRSLPLGLKCYIINIITYVPTDKLGFASLHLNYLHFHIIK